MDGPTTKQAKALYARAKRAMHLAGVAEKRAYQAWQRAMVKFRKLQVLARTLDELAKGTGLSKAKASNLGRPRTKDSLPGRILQYFVGKPLTFKVHVRTLAKVLKISNKGASDIAGVLVQRKQLVRVKRGLYARPAPPAKKKRVKAKAKEDKK